MHKKTIIRLEHAGRRADITVELRPGQVEGGKRTVALATVENYTELSVTAQLWEGAQEYSAGQCYDLISEWFYWPMTVREFMVEHEPENGWGDDATVERAYDDYCKRSLALTALVNLWDKWHMNGMRSGTDRQMAALADCESTDFSVRCQHLEKKGLLVDDRREFETPVDNRPPGTTAWTVGYDIGQDLRPKLLGGEAYKFGSAWLVEEIPAEAIEQLEMCCKILGAELTDPNAVVEPPTPLAELCEQHRIWVSANFVGEENVDGWQRRHFKVDLSRPGRGIDNIDFYQGLGHQSPPTVEDVVSCLILEVDTGEQSFEDYCSDTGEDPDSRKVHEGWSAAHLRAPLVRAFLGDEYDLFAGVAG